MSLWNSFESKAWEKENKWDFSNGSQLLQEPLSRNICLFIINLEIRKVVIPLDNIIYPYLVSNCV